MPDPTPETVAKAQELAKAKFAVGKLYQKINRLTDELMQELGVDAPITLPDGYHLMICDHLATKDTVWKNVCFNRYEAVLRDPDKPF